MEGIASVRQIRNSGTSLTPRRTFIEALNKARQSSIYLPGVSSAVKGAGKPVSSPKGKARPVS
jgi:hypothetical protein